MNLPLLYRILWVGGFAAWSLGVSAGAAAAPPGASDTLAPANEVTQFTGTLQGMRGSILTVTRDDGTEVLVQFPDSPHQVIFVAKALPAFLQRGMMVRFDTMMGPQGLPMSPVEKLEVFGPVNVRLIPGSLRTDWTPGIHPVDRHAKFGPNQPITGKVTVVGALMMLTPQGGLAVQAGKFPVQAMVSGNATLEVRFNDLTLAKEGDPVSVAGFYQPPDDTKVKADRITLRSDRVYGEAPERPVKPVRRARGAPPDES